MNGRPSLPGPARQAWDFVRNARPVRWGLDYATVLPDFMASRGPAADRAGLFDDVERYAMFIGVGRSGTTLIGSLLDAHPFVVMANQQGTLKYVRPRILSRDQIFYLLLRNAERAARGGRVGGGGYGYAVPGQWQGRFHRIRVIGDKSRSGDAVVRLTTFPGLLDALVRTVRVPIHMVHAIRNPFDTIATRSLRRRMPVEVIARQYLDIADRLATLIRRIEHRPGIERIPVRLEDFVADPRTRIDHLCHRLGLTADDGYLDACAGIVRPEPHRSRFDIEWDPSLIATIQRRVDTLPFFRHYQFDDPGP